MNDQPFFFFLKRADNGPKTEKGSTVGNEKKEKRMGPLGRLSVSVIGQELTAGQEEKKERKKR
jgi:hypothetical protein